MPRNDLQFIPTKWDVEIPDAISDGTPSPPAAKPAPLDLKIHQQVFNLNNVAKRVRLRR